MVPAHHPDRDGEWLSMDREEKGKLFLYEGPGHRVPWGKMYTVIIR